MMNEPQIFIATLICLVLIASGMANATGQQAGSKLLAQTDWLATHLNDSKVVICTLLLTGPLMTRAIFPERFTCH